MPFGVDGHVIGQVGRVGAVVVTGVAAPHRGHFAHRAEQHERRQEHLLIDRVGLFLRLTGVQRQQGLLRIDHRLGLRTGAGRLSGTGDERDVARVDLQSLVAAVLDLDPHAKRAGGLLLERGRDTHARLLLLDRAPPRDPDDVRRQRFQADDWSGAHAPDRRPNQERQTADHPFA